MQPVAELTPQGQVPLVGAELLPEKRIEEAGPVADAAAGAMMTSILHVLGIPDFAIKVIEAAHKGQEIAADVAAPAPLGIPTYEQANIRPNGFSPSEEFRP
jgi:hypothetical protein